MVAGRKPKPVELHIINGNPSKLNLAERIAEMPKFEITDMKCPSGLGRIAKKEWERIAPELKRLGLLTNADKTVFEMYCKVYGECIELENFIKKNGATYTYVKKNKYGQVISQYEMQYPQVTQLDKKRNLLVRICTEFGLTPSSRGRMSLPNSKKAEDPLEKFFGSN